jgi:hypothetical protein
LLAKLAMRANLFIARAGVSMQKQHTVEVAAPPQRTRRRDQGGMNA